MSEKVEEIILQLQEMYKLITEQAKATDLARGLAEKAKAEYVEQYGALQELEHKRDDIKDELNNALDDWMRLL